jgi:hypothetical protein
MTAADVLLIASLWCLALAVLGMAAELAAALLEGHIRGPRRW